MDELRERARRFEIFGWEEMGPDELRAAVETAEQEAPQADVPLRHEVVRSRAENGT